MIYNDRDTYNNRYVSIMELYTINELVEYTNNKLDLSSVEKHAPYLQKCYKLQQESGNDRIVTISTQFNYRDIFNQLENNRSFMFDENDLLCVKYLSEEFYSDQYLFYQLMREMNEKKIIFMFTDILEYFVGTHIKKKQTKFHELSHSVIYLFYPDSKKENSYHIYYINPHGETIKTYSSYDIMFSTSRKKCITIPSEFKCADFYMNHIFMLSFQKYIEKYKYNMNLTYTFTKHHNYLSTNL